ncbi:MAG: APC family permease, partial [bacterium]|nr:APC family permease [bacterium]
MLKEHKKIGLLSVIAISVSGIIGSGWLFSAYLGAKEAGSGVYISWFITLIFFLLMALVISEIVSLFPVRGLVGRMGVISHNRFFGAIFAFAIWLELVGSMPGEAQASVQYLSNLSPGLSRHLMSGGMLTFEGLVVTLLFLVIYWIVNIFGIKFFSKVNNAIAVYKLIIPVFVAILIMCYSFHSMNFEAFHHSLVPYGFNSVFMAITSAGMIYAFNGFQLGTSFASEIKNPTKTLPLGMIISIIICFIIYVLLQTSFIGALNGSQLSATGWHALNFNSPFVQLTSLLGLNFMTILLYVDACASPSGTGITFVGSASRILYGMSKEKQMPKIFSKLNKKYNFSKPAMFFNFLVALVFLFLFHSWAVLILFITALIVLMYMVVPISLIGMRHAMPDMKRKFRLPFAGLICTFLFIVQSMFFIFVGAKDMTYLTCAITIFMVIFMFINIPKHGEYKLKDIFAVSIPFLVYLWILTTLIILGPHVYGGTGVLGLKTMFILIGIFAIYGFYYLTNKK